MHFATFSLSNGASIPEGVISREFNDNFIIGKIILWIPSLRYRGRNIERANNLDRAFNVFNFNSIDRVFFLGY